MNAKNVFTNLNLLKIWGKNQTEESKMLGLKKLDANMRSCNNGKQSWKLGKTYRAKGKLVICENGYHLTYFPNEWNGSRVFLAEASEVGEIQKDKFVCRSVQLLKELSPKELQWYYEAIATERKRYAEAIATEEKRYDEAIATEEKRYYEAIATEEKRYYEAIAPEEKRYAEAIATERKRYDEAIAPEEKRYDEAIQEILKTFLPTIQNRGKE